MSRLATVFSSIGVFLSQNRRYGLLLPVLLLILLLVWEERPVRSEEVSSLATVFSLPAGYYERDVRLEMDVAHPDATIYFTLDGRLPTTADTPYTRPLPLSVAAPAVRVVRARAILPDGTAGPAASASYFMGLDATLPLLSLVVEPDDFWGEEEGIYVNHAARGRAWERPVDVTYVDEGRDGGFHVGAGVRIHGGWTRFFFHKKSLRLYFRREYDVGLLAYPFFGSEGQTEFDDLVLHNSGMDLLLFKNQLVDQLMRDLGWYATRSQPVLLFINGRSWGIYQLRERIDKRFLRENYGIEAADLSDTPNNRGMQSETQLAVDTVHWEKFMDFVAQNDLADPDNYAYVQSQIDLANFVDYYLVQMYAANTDWPHHNVHQFRPRTPGGRWQWIVWDNDFTFDWPQRQMVDHILVAQHPLGERMALLINKLLQNPHFHNLFVTRTADLMNTTLSSEQVLAHIDRLAADIEPDIHYEIERWSIGAEWQATVEEVREFARQRPQIMRQHTVESLQLPGTVPLSFGLAPGEAGWIVVNETPPQPLPWQGIYFQGSTIRLQAVAAAGYGFAGWEELPDGDVATEVITLTVGSEQTITPRFAPLPPAAPRPGDVVITAAHVNEQTPIEGDWIEMQVRRAGGVDLRGWRLSDNDSASATDEGSLILGDDALLAGVPQGATIRVVATKTLHNDEQFTADGWQGRTLVLYVGNGRVGTARDPWFNLEAHDNLVLLAPGPTEAFQDDVAIDLISSNKAVIPAAFGLPPQE